MPGSRRIARAKMLCVEDPLPSRIGSEVASQRIRTSPRVMPDEEIRVVPEGLARAQPAIAEPTQPGEAQRVLGDLDQDHLVGGEGAMADPDVVRAAESVPYIR